MAVPERFAHEGRLHDDHIPNAYRAEMWILAVLLPIQFLSVTWFTHQRTRGSDTLKRVLLAILALLLDFILLFCIFRIAALAMFKRASKDGGRSRSIAQALYGLTLPLLLLEYIRMLRRCLNSADPEHRVPHWGVLRVSMYLSSALISIASLLFLVSGFIGRKNYTVSKPTTWVGLGFLVLGLLCTIIQSLGVNGKGGKRGRLVSRLLQILLPVFLIRLIWLAMDAVSVSSGRDGKQYWSDRWGHTAGLEVFMDLLAVTTLIAARMMLGADLDKNKEGVPQV